MGKILLVLIVLLLTFNFVVALNVIEGFDFAPQADPSPEPVIDSVVAGAGFEVDDEFYALPPDCPVNAEPSAGDGETVVCAGEEQPETNDDGDIVCDGGSPPQIVDPIEVVRDPGTSEVVVCVDGSRPSLDDDDLLVCGSGESPVVDRSVQVVCGVGERVIVNPAGDIQCEGSGEAPRVITDCGTVCPGGTSLSSAGEVCVPFPGKTVAYYLKLFNANILNPNLENDPNVVEDASDVVPPRSETSVVTITGDRVNDAAIASGEGLFNVEKVNGLERVYVSNLDKIDVDVMDYKTRAENEPNKYYKITLKNGYVPVDDYVLFDFRDKYIPDELGLVHGVYVLDMTPGGVGALSQRITLRLTREQVSDNRYEVDCVWASGTDISFFGKSHNYRYVSINNCGIQVNDRWGSDEISGVLKIGHVWYLEYLENGDIIFLFRLKPKVDGEDYWYPRDSTE